MSIDPGDWDERRAQGTEELERRKVRADHVLEALEAMPAAEVAALGAALDLGGGPLRKFGMALLSFAEGNDRVARLKMAWTIRQLATYHVDEALLGRLEAAESEPWQALSQALRAELADAEESEASR